MLPSFFAPRARAPGPGRPEVAKALRPLDRYDTVFLASPIWNVRGAPPGIPTFGRRDDPSWISVGSGTAIHLRAEAAEVDAAADGSRKIAGRPEPTRPPGLPALANSTAGRLPLVSGCVWQ